MWSPNPSWPSPPIWRVIRVVGSGLLLDTVHGCSHHGRLAQTRGEVEGCVTVPKASSAVVRQEASPHPPVDQRRWGNFCQAAPVRQRRTRAAGQLVGSSKPSLEALSHSEPWEESLSDSGAWSCGGGVGFCCARDDPGCRGTCCSEDPPREGPVADGAAPPGCWDPVRGTRGDPEEGGWGADPGQKGILARNAWARPRVASCCREDSGGNYWGRGCCLWLGHGNPPINCGGNQGPPQGVLNPCGVYEGPHWVTGAVTEEAAIGWAVTVTVAAKWREEATMAAVATSGCLPCLAHWRSGLRCGRACLARTPRRGDNRGCTGRRPQGGRCLHCLTLQQSGQVKLAKKGVAIGPGLRRSSLY